MRDIKFRAWDSWKKRFIFFDAEDGIFSQVYKTYFRENVGPFQQYTGLTDKNGKEIYEGDIVTFEYCGDIVVGAVIWSKYEWRVDGWNPCYDAIPDERCDDYVDWHLCEVIGNIHENTELLEEA